MTRSLVIDAGQNEREQISVKLVGKMYVITPPKASLAMKIAKQAQNLRGDDRMAILDLLQSWLRKAFGPKQYEKLAKRLDDEDDLLDISHLLKLMEAVIEGQTAPQDEKPDPSTT